MFFVLRVAFISSATCEYFAQSQHLSSSPSRKLKVANMHLLGASAHCESIHHSTRAPDVYETPRERPWLNHAMVQWYTAPPYHGALLYPSSLLHRAIATQQFLKSPFSFTCFTEHPLYTPFPKECPGFGGTDSESVKIFKNPLKNCQNLITASS